MPGQVSSIVGLPSVHGKRQGNLARAFNTKHSGPDFHENVITSLEFGGQELDEIGSTPILPVSDTVPIDSIEIDFAFKSGLYRINEYGDFTGISVEVSVDVYEKDPTGSLNLLVGKYFVNFSHSLENVSPLRRSVRFKFDGSFLPLIRVTRTTGALASDGRSSSALTIDNVKGYATPTSQSVYKNTTILPVRIKASELTSNASNSRIQVTQQPL